MRSVRLVRRSLSIGSMTLPAPVHLPTLLASPFVRGGWGLRAWSLVFPCFSRPARSALVVISATVIPEGFAMHLSVLDALEASGRSISFEALTGVTGGRLVDPVISGPCFPRPQLPVEEF